MNGTLWSSHILALLFSLFTFCTLFIFSLAGSISPDTHFFKIFHIEQMERSRDEGKMVIPVHGYDDEGEEDEEDNKRKRALNPSKRRGASSGGSTQRSCQVEDCTVDMTAAKPYHRRHKVCEFHAKAAVVVLSGQQQRFCQQCSRFHELTEFDEAKRSCRRRLAGHNERRRKNSYDSQ